MHWQWTEEPHKQLQYLYLQYTVYIYIYIYIYICMSEECCRSWHSHGRCEHMKEPCKLSVPKTLLVFCVSGCNSKRSRELESGQCDPVSSWRIQLNIEVKMKRDGEVNPWPVCSHSVSSVNVYECAEEERQTDVLLINIRTLWLWK